MPNAIGSYSRNEWIKFAKRDGFFKKGFSPFRYVRSMPLGAAGRIVVYWTSFFVNKDKKLERFYPQAEEIVDTAILGNEKDYFNAMRRLNEVEEKEYVKRARSLSTSELRVQLDLWEVLQDELPMGGWKGSSLQYPPIRILRHELGDRAASHVEESLKHKARVSKKRIVSLVSAVKDVRRELEKSIWRGQDRIEVCRRYLLTHGIRNKPSYTAEKLNNLLAKLVDSERNKRPPPK